MLGGCLPTSASCAMHVAARDREAEVPLALHRFAVLDTCSVRYNSTMASAITFGNSNAGLQAGVIHGSVHAEFRLSAGKSERIWVSAPSTLHP
jgi:hypothetical protein